jgi:hypothetical protein
MVELDKTDARQGRTTGRVRYILAISLAAAILAMVLVGIFVR